jgi:hypothetical protein
MRRTVRTIVTLLFLGIVVAVGFAVLYFGTSTGLISGGGATYTGGATKTVPYFAQIGWVRNTAPWPVTIKSITTNAEHTAKPTQVYIEAKHDSEKYTLGTVPPWTKISARPPYELVGGSLRYLGFGLTPATGQVASFTTFTVTFSGPLGLTFHKTFSGPTMAARAAGLPSTILAPDPTVDGTPSLDSYIALLRGVLQSRKPAATAVVMGGDATTADAQKFLAGQRGYASKFQLVATPVPKDPYSDTLVFYKTSPTKGALAPITVTWSGFRWSVKR